MHTAHFQFELYKTEGPIGELINTLGIKTSQNALPSISALLAKSPLSQPPLVMFKPALREALQEAKQASPVARELWASLFREERASILKSAAKLARSIAVRDYAATN
jgi:acyl-CoA reductase-like NAD-dependent aldehyde dehydrogenase